MNAAEREQLRLALLRYLEDDGSAVFGLPTARLVRMALNDAFDTDARQVEQELDYLLGAGLVAEVAKRLSPELRAWKITKDGRDLRAQVQAQAQ